MMELSVPRLDSRNLKKNYSAEISTNQNHKKNIHNSRKLSPFYGFSFKMITKTKSTLLYKLDIYVDTSGNKTEF